MRVGNGTEQQLPQEKKSTSNCAKRLKTFQGGYSPSCDQVPGCLSGTLFCGGGIATLVTSPISMVTGSVAAIATTIGGFLCGCGFGRGWGADNRDFSEKTEKVSYQLKTVIACTKSLQGIANSIEATTDKFENSLELGIENVEEQTSSLNDVKQNLNQQVIPKIKEAVKEIRSSLDTQGKVHYIMQSTLEETQELNSSLVDTFNRGKRQLSQAKEGLNRAQTALTETVSNRERIHHNSSTAAQEAEELFSQNLELYSMETDERKRLISAMESADQLKGKAQREKEELLRSVEQIEALTQSLGEDAKKDLSQLVEIYPFMTEQGLTISELKTLIENYNKVKGE